MTSTAARIARGYEEVAGESGRYVMTECRLLADYAAANDNFPVPDIHPAELADLVGLATYVATPYTKYQHGHAAAAYDAAEVTANLMRIGIPAFSPIAHSHAVAHVGRLDKVDHDFWQRMDAPWVRLAEACVVVKMPGWEESAGMQHEIEAFRAAGKPVVFMDWGNG